jgi:hypothetical protein
MDHFSIDKHICPACGASWLPSAILANLRCPAEQYEVQASSLEHLLGKGVVRVAKSNSFLCLVCYNPMSFLRENEVPEELIREFACATRLNMGMIEHRGWVWCADCKYYTHLPTVPRLLKDYRKKLLSQKR